VGGLRPNFWLKHLKKYGVHPVVVTRQWGNSFGSELDYVAPGHSPQVLVEEFEYGTIIRTPYTPNLANRLLLRFGPKRLSFLRRMISAWYEFLQFLFIVGPKAGLYRGARQYLSNDRVDVIIATGDPFILFRYGSKLSREFNIPWIADYRDPWVEDNNYSSNLLLKKWYSFFERRYLENVHTITTVSTYLQAIISQNLVGKKFVVLPNGYDPAAVAHAGQTLQGRKILTIALAGLLYEYHPWKLFLEVCNQWKTDHQGARFKIDFYGIKNHSEVSQFVDAHCKALKGCFTIHPKTPHHELMHHLAHANLFLLFNNYSMVHTKLYEYIALRRKILLCFTNDENAFQLKTKKYPLQDLKTESGRVQEELIIQTRSGINVTDSNYLYRVLDECYHEFKTNGFIECNPTGVEQFSRLRQVEHLARLLKEACNEHRSL
jgi:glycosyltransferase involved in cell wall biosynthesis